MNNKPTDPSTPEIQAAHDEAETWTPIAARNSECHTHRGILLRRLADTQEQLEWAASVANAHELYKTQALDEIKQTQARLDAVCVWDEGHNGTYDGSNLYIGCPNDNFMGQYGLCVAPKFCPECGNRVVMKAALKGKQA